MSFKDLMKADIKNNMLNTTEFGEAIIYVAKDGTQSPINAHVERGLLESSPGGAETYGKEILVLIVNDADDGVTSVDVTGDYVLVSTLIGESASRHKVVQILEHDEVIWYLRCMK